MAKTLRAINCPQCGSPDKTTLGPDLFRCTACQTEYYLDSDDVTVHVQHHYPTPPLAPRPAPTPARYWVASGFLLLAVGALTWLCLLVFRPHGQASQVPMMSSKPIFYPTRYVYADAGQQPVYVTLRTEAPRWGSDSTTLYADFFDPRTGQLRHEQVLQPLGQHPDDHLYSWHTFPGGRVYLLSDQRLYKVDTRVDRLDDVTDSFIAKYPPASSGVAEVSFDDAQEALRVLTNDGQTFYYLPATGAVLADGPALAQAAYAGLPRRFLTLDVPFGAERQEPVLLANRPTGHYPGLDTQNLTPRRRYFEPHIVYQDATSLLISSSPTARPDGPQSLQRLDPLTGRVLWARAPGPYLFAEAARTGDGGFVVQYSTGPEHDYVHGALLISADGQRERDFQRKRLE